MLYTTFFLILFQEERRRLWKGRHFVFLYFLWFPSPFCPPQCVRYLFSFPVLYTNLSLMDSLSLVEMLRTSPHRSSLPCLRSFFWPAPPPCFHSVFSFARLPRFQEKLRAFQKYLRPFSNAFDNFIKELLASQRISVKHPQESSSTSTNLSLSICNETNVGMGTVWSLTGLKRFGYGWGVLINRLWN